jgi:CDP-2,3-bis-(O-geranylgeranyl)-sn-glycerol synthase
MILEAIWYFLPAYFANMAPPMFNWFGWFKGLAKPINEPLFGKNKTYRGVVAAVCVGFIVFILQKVFRIESFELFDYERASLMIGLLLGMGAILGDLAESFLKRRIGIKSGKPFIPFDQLDFVFGGLVLSTLVFVPSIKIVLVLVVISPLFHLFANRMGYWLKITRKY